MKTLKRSLSLVLVLVLAFSLCATALAASNFDKYTDASKVTYTEAVDTLLGINIVDGMTTTTLDPQGTYTRAQGAVLITRLILGRTATEALNDNVSPFGDVPAGHWAAGEIAYCVSQGIIDGIGNNRFDPEGSLTGYAVFKMVLCAIGYGQKDEFLGANWTIEVSKLAMSEKIDLWAGNKAGNFSNTATREEAMLYVFNGLTVPKVVYSALLGTYTTSSSLVGDSVDYGYLADAHNLGKRTGLIDDEGYSCHVWYVGNNYSVKNEVTNWYRDDDVAGTVDASVTGGTLNNDYDFGTITTLVINGEEFVPTYNSDGTENTVPGILADLRAAINANVKKGNSTKIFDSTPSGSAYFPGKWAGSSINLIDADKDGEIDKVVITYAYIAKVTRVTAATSSADRKINATVYGTDVGGTGTHSKSVTGIETEDFDKDDYILITPDGFTTPDFVNPIIMELAKSEDSSISAFSGTSNVTIDSGKYNYNFTMDTSSLSYAFSSTYTFYFDAAGNVIYKTTVVNAVPQYLYVRNSQASADELISSSGNVVKVAVTYLDGTTATVDYAIKTASSNLTSSTGSTSVAKGKAYITLNGEYYLVEALAASSAKPVPNGLYRYTENDSGEITLTNVDLRGYTSGDNVYTGGFSNTGTFETTKGSARINTTIADANGVIPTYASSSTSLVLSDNGTVTTYSGYNNFRSTTYTATSDITIAYITKDGVVSNILIVGATASATSYVYGAYKGGSTSVEGGTEYPFYVDGKEETYTIEDGSGLTAPATKGAVYRLSVTEEKGIIESITATAVSGTEDGFVVNGTVTGTDSDYFVVGGVPYYFDDLIVCDVRSSETGDWTDSADLENSNVVSFGYTVDSNNRTVKTVYIVG